MQIHAALKITDIHAESDSIEHVTSRIKSADSTIAKLIRHRCEPTEENAIENLSDIIGYRMVVHFVSDIYEIRNMLIKSGRFKIVKEKDYVANPKETGYRGYHIIVETTINGLTMRSEIQLRTIAMDCWASLEHKIRYKKKIRNAELVHEELKRCAENLMLADESMEYLLDLARIEEANIAQ